MKKTYWWRIVVLLVGAIAFCFGWQFDGFHTGLCSVKNGAEDCLIEYSPYAGSMLILSVVFIFVGSILFFVKDSVFIKWLRFVLAWCVITIFFVSRGSGGGGWISFGLNKEAMAIIMGFIFLIVSIFIIVYKSLQLKKE